MTDKTEIWIIKGYETFALLGYKGLIIEQLAKEVGISKSSFYHHFADLDIFIEKILLHHLKKSSIIAEKERKAEKINPDLINILIEHKTDLLFNRQLRIDSNKSNFKDALIKSSKIIGTDFIKLWLTDTKLNLTSKQAEGIFELAMENFFLQINQDNINQEWLSTYFDNLNRITRNFENPIVR
ncbi:MAG TPA: TetR/AcrR family transcriptional regulator [Cytophagales bacterium]|mgnify:CR=1 FL=1|jgi:AcrR family transcriptional regulator|nr:TetR/AcrR family transcriptional regulator [Cytophagales bacterium]